MEQMKATTICAVKDKNGDICIGGDGQVTFGQSTVMKKTAKKIRKIYNGKVLSGFAGSVADAFSLTERFEKKLEEHGGNLKKSAVSLAEEWRSDKAIRHLEALMIVADNDSMLVISGNGEVIEPDDNFIAIGSGGNFAHAAAHALYKHTNLTAEEIVKEALSIASEICVYTNSNIVVEKLEKKEKSQEGENL